jgi:acyl-CoA thioesterase
MDLLTTQTTPVRSTGTSTDRIAYSATIADGWQQGRGAYGGVVVGLLTRAMIDATESALPLRSISAELVGATLVGDARIEVETLRRGSGTHTVSARLIQGEELRAHAVAIAGRDRAPDLAWTALEPPKLRPWSDMPIAPIQPPLAPTFARHFEYRTDGPFPFSGGSEAITSGWVRPREAASIRDAGYLAAIADAWWPAAFSVLTGPRPMSTITFLLQLVHPPDGLDPSAPLAYRARCLSAHAGHLIEVRELWSPEGQLLALNTQTFVVIQ